MKEKLHDSWLRLVHGPKRRKPIRREPRPPGPTDPVERVKVPFPQKRKWFHTRPLPPLTVVKRYPTGRVRDMHFCSKCGKQIPETEWVKISGGMRRRIARCPRCGYSKQV